MSMSNETQRIDGPEPQSNLINQLASSFVQDERILACWLHGSFGRGSTDQYSDIDMALVVPDDKFYQAFQVARQIACGAKECVVSWDSPKDINGGGFTAFYADCNLLDVKVYRSSRVPKLRNSDTIRILFDREGLLHRSDETSPDEYLGPPLAEQVRWKMIFFWICVYSAVRFLKRRNFWYAEGLINAVRGTLAQLLWLWTHPGEPTDLSFVVWGVVRRDLPPELVSQLEETVSESERSEMTATLGRIIDLFNLYGRRIAEETGAEYPELLANAVMEYFHRECG